MRCAANGAHQSGGPVVAESDRGNAYDGTPNHIYEEGTTLPAGIRAIKQDGLWGGEHALLWRAPGGELVAFTGDVLNGQVETELSSPEHFRWQPGLYFGSRPQFAERHHNPASLASSIRRVAAESPSLLCGAHARPFRDNPAQAIEKLAASIST